VTAERVPAQLEVGLGLEAGEESRDVAGDTRARQGERRDVDGDADHGAGQFVKALS
jgi:hypothetical protein